MSRIDTARRLRQEASLPERLLWPRLRSGRLDGHKFRRQAPIGRYIADFACVRARLIVELDGPHHQERAEADQRRTEVLEGQGWHVLRFENVQVFNDIERVLEAIRAELRLARP